MQILTEQLIHDLIIHEVKNKYARIHKEVHINPGEEKNFEIQGLYPDVIFGGYGQIIQVVEVEMEQISLKSGSLLGKISRPGNPLHHFGD